MTDTRELHFTTDAQYKKFAAEHEAKAKAHATAEVIARQFSDFAADPAPSESSGSYRRRLAGQFQKYSQEWGKVDLRTVPPDAFAIAEAKIYADAVKEAREPTSLTLAPGEVVVRETRDAAGRVTRRYFGDARGVWAQFQNPLHTGRFVIPK